MQIFVFDEDGGPNQREWNAIVDESPVRLRWEGYPEPGQFDIRPPAESVIVCHDLDDGQRQAIAELARNGAFVVVIAGSDGERRLMSQNVYIRGKPVGKPTDDHFRACFTVFLRALQATGKPNWALLEGSPPPDNLIAYHLLGFLGDEGNEERKRIADAATEEAIAIILAKGEKTRFEEAKLEASKALADNSSVANFLKEKCAE